MFIRFVWVKKFKLIKKLIKYYLLDLRAFGSSFITKLLLLNITAIVMNNFYSLGKFNWIVISGPVFSSTLWITNQQAYFPFSSFCYLTLWFDSLYHLGTIIFETQFLVYSKTSSFSINICSILAFLLSSTISLSITRGVFL